MRTYTFLTLLLLPFALTGNPFKIDFPIKENITEEDYLEIQTKLDQIDIRPFLDSFYPKDPPKNIFKPWSSSLASKQDFEGRISKALHQTLAIKGKGSPIKKLQKINKGGENCIVCYASLNGKYEDLIQNLPKELEKVGFNGHLFYMVGGFPNPTGKEIQYCGVPYCFKIFMLLEAQKLGFSKVLWIDSSFLPLKDPTPLFDWIEKEGSFLKLHESFKKFILPKTQKYIEKITGVDVVKSTYVSAQIIGFDLSKPLPQEFIKKYYDLVELGFPFFSCFPEEYVFSSIIGQKLDAWKSQPYKELVFSEIKLKGKDPSWVKEKGYFFLQKEH
jgi:hypothetical protein